MSARANHSKTHIWLESLGDWAWPGTAAPAEVLPPPWVPTAPTRAEFAFAGTAGAERAPWLSRPRARRRVFAASLAAGLLAFTSALALRSSRDLEALLGVRHPGAGVVLGRTPAAVAAAPLPALVPMSRDGAGSTIGRVSYSSAALAARGAFLVYLPPGYPGAGARYPVLYLLHGRDGHASAFLEIGLQRTLDRMIAGGEMPPLVAVMIQDLGGLKNWRNIGRRRSESYVLEVQELVDRMLPTLPARAARAIAGGSYGGFGAMQVALMNPDRFAVVESWLGFFDGLEGRLQADAPALSRLGLHAFLYGAAEDPVAIPEEDITFAAQLRAAGADAQGVIYAGGHSLEKLSEHLHTALLFAAHALGRAADEESTREARARWRA